MNGRLAISAFACLAVVSACSSQEREPPRTPRVITLPSGSTVTLPPEAAGREESDGDRVSITGDDGVVWSVQAIPSSAGRSLDEVAIALGRRVELGEVNGELLHRPCSFAGLTAQCIDGWQQGSDGHRLTRRGAIVEVSNEILWISVAAREDAPAISTYADALASTTRVARAR